MKETKFILCVFINTRIFFYLFTLKTNKRPSGLNGHLSFNCNAMKMKQNHITIHNKVSYSRCCFCRQLKLSVHVNCNQCHFISYVKIFVLVILAINGIGHYRGHLFYINTSCLFIIMIEGIITWSNSFWSEVIYDTIKESLVSLVLCDQWSTKGSITDPANIHKILPIKHWHGLGIYIT